MGTPLLYASDRRTFLMNASALGVAALATLPRQAVAEPPPEVRRIRLTHTQGICLAPMYLAEELLRLEGFSDVDYVEYDAGDVYSGKVDFSQETAPQILPAFEMGHPVVALAGIHVGCFELVANERIGAIRDLKGKRIAITTSGGAGHLFLSSMFAYVGIDPRKDINWVMGQEPAKTLALFTEDKADAIMCFAPQPQDLRARKIGHVLVNTALDRPWSQYFCCMLVANREFANSYPIATKRALRAFLKATDICAREPERVARLLVEKGYEPRYAIALEVLKELPYNRWREANPEDTLRFHALRLHEAGVIKSTPQKLLAQGTDWRYLNELKRELKS
jgi:NitT/TauT family transport system substrate-binding protein